MENFSKVNGLAFWIDYAKSNIEDIKQKGAVQSEIVRKEWSKYSETKNLRGNTNCYEWYITGQYMCQNYFSKKGPLMTTKWGQQGLSNYYTPDDNQCSECHDNAVAGCGPVAMAQTLRAIGVLHGNFGGRQFQNMPIYSDPCKIPSAGGEDELADLISDCGQSATTDYHFFSCETLTLPSSIPGAMSSMGLSSGGSKTSFNPNTIRLEIDLDYPVIVKGKKSLNNQHIWVCDGYDIHEYSEYDCDIHACETFAYTYYHMNWGWNGGYDGWFAIGAFSPGGVGYNSNLEMISGYRK